ncbi:MFS transporter small subunit [Micromonospora sp. NBC_01796]|nr:hypothetical protein [Micromonospora sp. NBC_01796]WSA85727.1 hypothetical protein OIE47_36195 [Micromonospora sp. NBC_01796]
MTGNENHPTVGRQRLRLWASWLLVVVLLGYGVVQTARTAVNLFTH